MYTNFEIFLANFSFLILFISMLIYWVQASNSVGNKKKDSFLTIKETKFSLSQKIVSVFNGVYSERAVGTLATMIANASLFLLLVLRWKESGHFPLSNLYESLMFLSWSLTLIHLFIEIGFSSHHSRLPHSACPPLHSASLTLAPLAALAPPQRGGDPGLLRGKGQGEGEGPTLTRGGGNKGAGTQSALIFDQPQTQKGLIASRLIGSITAPSALFTNAFATFSLPKEMQEASPLVPALQSNWLMMHVTVMILSYAALILGSLLSIGFLVITSGQNINLSSNAEAITQSTILNKVSPQTLPFGFNFNVFNSIPPFTPPLLNTPLGRPPSVAELIPGGQGGEGGALTASDALVMTNQLENKKEYAPKGHMPGGQKGSGTKSAELHLHEHTDKINVRESYRLNLARTLDNLSYRVLGLGFPLLTIGILSGAVWANEAWGSYWSWDPKETWALLTWLVFAIYLHTRLTKGWEGRKPALIASLGFVTVWVCFLGVNLIGEGLHSYGWIAQS